MIQLSTFPLHHPEYVEEQVASVDAQSIQKLKVLAKDLTFH